jgi:hypothetical protein
MKLPVIVATCLDSLTKHGFDGMAEREGFEPTVLFRYSRFPGVRLKPLSHLSNHVPNVANAALRRNIFPPANWRERNAVLL